MTFGKPIAASSIKSTFGQSSLFGYTSVSTFRMRMDNLSVSVEMLNAPDFESLCAKTANVIKAGKSTEHDMFIMTNCGNWAAWYNNFREWYVLNYPNNYDMLISDEQVEILKTKETEFQSWRKTYESLSGAAPGQPYEPPKEPPPVVPEGAWSALKWAAIAVAVVIVAPPLLSRFAGPKN